MRVLLGGNKRRGVAVLEALADAGHELVGVVAHPDGDRAVAEAATARGLPLHEPSEINEPSVVAALRALEPDVVVLAGYGSIVKQEFIDLAPRGCINLHAGKLPQYRGSSPLNWALINGEPDLTVSVIQVDSGVDSGDVLAERTFSVGGDETIADAHRYANAIFPELVLQVLAQIEAGTLRPRVQDDAEAAYYPLRFPDDGLLLWDTTTAAQAHDRIRALTRPYPGAFTFWQGHRLTILRSRPADRVVHGEPGRVYAVSGDELLVCASDRCLWLVDIEAEDGSQPQIARYDRLATARGLAVEGLS